MRLYIFVCISFVLLLLFTNLLITFKELLCWPSIMLDVIAYDRNHMEIRRKDAFLIGGVRTNKAHLIIGVPTVYREYNHTKAFYLRKTLKSMIDPLSKQEKDNVQFIILLAGREEKKRRKLYEQITTDFEAELKNGLINVIGVPDRYYLPLENLPSTFKDTTQRMYWRSKQALDYTFMLNYAHKLCNHYMQIEDDVIAVKDYLQIILREIQETERQRTSENKHPLIRVHEFYHMGFIGRVFEASYLPFMSSYIRLFYDQIPVDLIYPYAIHFSYGKSKKHNDLFEHIGLQSSSQGT